MFGFGKQLIWEFLKFNGTSQIQVKTRKVFKYITILNL